MPAAPRREPADTSAAPSFDEVADELYGLAPEEFTAARTRHEKAARRRGDRDEAASIHALAKPSVPAWLANQLVREQRDALAPLLELGAGLREATARLAGEDLRRLSRQQHEVVAALVQQARSIARTAGRPVSDDAARALEDTLRAALAEDAAAQQLLAGRLTKALPPPGFGGSGFGGGGAAETPVRKSAPAGKPKKARASDDEQRRRAERELTEAQSALAEAAAALDEARASRDDAQARVTESDQAAQATHAKVEELRRQLEEATAAASDADRLRHDQAEGLRRAEGSVRAAERRHAQAQERRDRLAAGA